MKGGVAVFGLYTVRPDPTTCRCDDEVHGNEQRCMTVLDESLLNMAISTRTPSHKASPHRNIVGSITIESD
jgi:hypothetical protein